MNKISIIIPTLNRSNLLDATLNSIVNQLHKVQLEVIVIDNGSIDDTKEIVTRYINVIPNLIYEFNNIPGLLTGRHRAIELSTGKILCFLDDDVQLSPNYTKSLFDTFSKNPTLKLATGPCLPLFEIQPPGWLKYFWDETSQGKYCSWLSLLNFGKHEIEISPLFVWGLNFCIRKETLISLGGFHPDCVPDRLQQFQGDGETGLTLKAIQNDHTARYVPGLMLKHYVAKERLTFDYFKKRAFFQGVCNSFTNLRLTAGLQAPKPSKKTLRDRLHPYYKWIKFIIPNRKKALPVEIELLFHSLTQAESEGYNFHQSQFTNNEQVEQWVLKSDYWDYNLPSI